MPTYLITNRVPEGFTGSPDAFAAWTAWFGELGDHLGNCGAGTVLGGYTLISAEDLDAAVALAQTHPLMTRGGGVEVGELTLLNEGRHLIAEQDGR